VHEGRCGLHHVHLRQRVQAENVGCLEQQEMHVRRLQGAATKQEHAETVRHMIMHLKELHHSHTPKLK
jgi:hypothetical protein